MSDNLRYLKGGSEALALDGHDETGLVVVLGMHRSGTSALAGVLVAAGAWAGNPDELMEPNEYNALGYHERRSTAAALDEALLALGGTWSNPPLDNLDPSRLESHRPVIQSVVAGLIDGAPGGTLALLKDPRLCLFASELAASLGDSAKVVLSLRHPVEVARSLLERDSIPISTGLALWELYNTSVCSGLAGRPVYVVRYDQLLEDPEVMAELLGYVLGEDGPPADEMYRAAAGSVSDALRHQRFASGDKADWMSPPVARLWRTLDQAAQARQPRPLEQAWLSQASRELLLMPNVARRAAAGLGLPEEVEDSPDALAKAHTEITQLGAELARQERRVRAGVAEREALSQDVAEARERAAVSTKEVERVQAELRDRAAEVRAGAAEREALGQELEGARGRIAELVSEADAGRILSRRLAAEVAELRTQHARQSKEAGATRERAVRLEARAKRVERERDDAVVERDALADALSALQREAEELSEDAEVFWQDWSDLQVELSRVRDESDSRLADLIASHDQREQLALRLKQMRMEVADAVADARHRLLVETDRAKGFVESLRSIVGDFHREDIGLTTLDEAELVGWARMSCEERERLREANAKLLVELQAVNGHRDELTGYLASIWNSESWKIGRAITWPARALRGRPTAVKGAPEA